MTRESSTSTTTQQQNNTKPIFLRKDGRPFYFFLLPNANVFQVRQLIQRYGGVVMDKPPFRGQDCLVVSNKDIPSRQLKRDFRIVSVDYIVKSLNAATMLPLSDFLVSKKRELQNVKPTQTQSSPVKKVKVDSPVKQNIQTSPIKKSSTAEQPSSPLIKSTASPFKQTQPISSPQKYVPAPSPRKTSADFTSADDILLFKMVSARLQKDEKGHVLTYEYDGHQIFRDLYDSGRFPDQTITSLNQRYSTHILPNLNSFIVAQNNASQPQQQKKRNFETEADLELEEPPQSMHMDSSFEFSTQAPLNTTAPNPTSALDCSVDCQERDVILHLADHYDVSYELAIYALYATSGVVYDAQLLLSNPSVHGHLAWDTEDDIIILRHRDNPKTPGYGPLVRSKGLDAVIKRCSFLVSFITNS